MTGIVRVTISLDYGNYKYGDTVFFAPDTDTAFDRLITMFGEDASTSGDQKRRK